MQRTVSVSVSSPLDSGARNITIEFPRDDEGTPVAIVLTAMVDGRVLFNRPGKAISVADAEVILQAPQDLSLGQEGEGV
jgi:hypothetical protein